MNHFKYLIRTFYQLPLSRHIFDNPWSLLFLLKRMMAKKPDDIPFPDLEKSISCTKIDTHVCHNWQDIFSEMKLWNWDTVARKKGAKCHA